jgi:hypothetical protein
MAVAIFPGTMALKGQVRIPVFAMRAGGRLPTSWPRCYCLEGRP